MTVNASDIKAAAKEIEGEVMRTPLVAAPRLSEILGCELYLKLENQQYTGSFKDRGALNKLKSLTAEQVGYGIITMSAGNHAQGVAHHARRLGIPATIVMPEFAPFTKVERMTSPSISLAAALMSEALTVIVRFSPHVLRALGVCWNEPEPVHRFCLRTVQF